MEKYTVRLVLQAKRKYVLEYTEPKTVEEILRDANQKLKEEELSLWYHTESVSSSVSSEQYEATVVECQECGCPLPEHYQGCSEEE